MPVQITINGGDAAEAVKELSALASHLGGGQPAAAAPVQAAPTQSAADPVYLAGQQPAPQQSAPQPAAAQPAPQPQQPAAPQQYAQQPAVPVAQPAAAQPSAQPPVQTPPTTPPTTVPTTAQSYTLEQLAVAATPLMDAGRGAELTALLQQFGVSALTQLPRERYGEFATALRALGARI